MHSHARTPARHARAVLLAALVLLGLVVAAGVLRADGPSSASTGTASCSPARQWYVDANGRPQLLPWCGEAPGDASVVYVGRWLRGPKLDIAAAAPTVTPSPSPSASASPTPTASATSSSTASTGELAPVLSLDGVPAVVGTAGRVDVRWTPAKAPGGAAVAFYVVQGRASNEAAWTQRGGSTTATHATVTGLTPGSEVLLRVQAVYDDGTRGREWSNTLAVSVPLAVN